MNARGQRTLIANVTLLGAIAALTVVQVGIVVIYQLMQGGSQVQALPMSWIVVANQILFLAAPVIYYVIRREERPLLRLRPNAKMLWAIPCALLAMPCMTGLGILGEIALKQLNLSQGDSSLLTQLDLGFVATFLMISVAPSIGEEMMFRGLMLPAYQHLPRGRMILMAGLLFGLMHGVPAAIGSHIAIGVLICALYFSTDSLWTGSLFHFLYNGLIVVVEYLFMKPELESLGNTLFGTYAAEQLPRALIMVFGFGIPLLILVRVIWQRDKRKNPEKYIVTKETTKSVTFESTWPLILIFGYYALTYLVMMLGMVFQSWLNRFMVG